MLRQTVALAEHRPNLVLLVNTRVSKIQWSGKSLPLEATGVSYIDADGKSGFMSGKNVILSAGALHTPKILELSGIGDPTILKPLGIDTLFANPAVGSNLQNQIGVSVVFQLANVTGKSIAAPFFH